jgi:hypothetical protein
MKTLHQWLMELPEPIKTKALLNIDRQRRGKWVGHECRDLSEAINMAFFWDKTPEGHFYWLQIAEGQFSDKGSSEPESPTQTPTNTDMSKYADIPVATPTLVFGTDVSDLKPCACIATIKANNAQIKELTETGIESPYITKQIAGLNAANAALVAQLDSHA